MDPEKIVIICLGVIIALLLFLIIIILLIRMSGKTIQIETKNRKLSIASVQEVSR